MTKTQLSHKKPKMEQRSQEPNQHNHLFSVVACLFLVSAYLSFAILTDVFCLLVARYHFPSFNSISLSSGSYNIVTHSV